MDLLANFSLGLSVALSPVNLLYCLVGVSLGMLIGIIPGIGTLAAISVLFPITFHLEPTAALIMLAGIWYGTAYGGSTASILLNLPGTPSNAVTCLDGYPMAQQGRAGVALFMTTAGSFVGGSIGIIIMMMFSPLIASVAIRFGSPEYFSLMLLGLVAASTITTESAIKGLAMITLGVAFGTVGTDLYTGVERYNFGISGLADGIGLISVAMGLFGISEVIASARHVDTSQFTKNRITYWSMLPSRDDLRRSWMPMLRGTGIGSFFGVLPGTGPSIAAFISYAVEVRVSRDRSRFGKGAIEGVVSPETANNAADQTAFIPTLVLGIPGSATMALIIGALMVHGIAPGPQMLTDHAELFWGLVMSFWIGNVILLFLNIPLIGIWVKLLTVPYHLLYPSMLVFVCIGSYAVRNNLTDVWLVLFFGLVGYVMRVLRFPAAPLLLGFVLGPLMEEHFRRALLISRGDLMTFLVNPISGTVLVTTAALLVWSFIGGRLFRRQASAASSAQ